MRDFKAGYVAILGKTNAGKSTFLNQVLQFKLSIVTPKPQTTRKRVIGILNSEDYQIIFIDTPGIIEPKYTLHEVMMKYVKKAAEDADVVLYMVDVSLPNPVEADAKEKIEPFGKPVILLLNKIDLIKRELLLPIIDQYRNIYPFEAIVPISALKNDGIDRVISEVVKLLPVNPPYYPQDYLTSQQERFFVAEIIREKIFLLYGEEIPYSTHVEIEEFREREEGKDYILAHIFVEKDSQKGILIGKKGQALRRVGELARKEIEEFLGRSVFLELYVKVSKDWRKKEGKLKELGY